MCALLARIAVVRPVKSGFEARIGRETRVAGGWKQHLDINSNAVQVTNARLRIREIDAPGRKMRSVETCAEFFQDPFRLVSGLRARAEGAWQEATFNQPAIRITAEVSGVFDTYLGNQ